MLRTSNTVLKRQARKMVYDVYSYMKSAYDKENDGDVLKRTAVATQTSVSTVRRIIAQCRESATLTTIRTPGKSRTGKKRVTGLDSFDKSIIKRCIHNFHITENDSPSVDKLRKKLQEDINFKGSDRSLRRIIKELSFQWKKTANNTKILIEKTNIRLMRIEYLQKLNKFREEGRTIVYIDELYVDSNSCQYMWTDGANKEVKKPINKCQSAVIVHAGSEAGFIPNALCIFKSGTKGGGDDNINIANYEKWLRNQLLPNLPPNSVLVFDNASYHNKQYDPAPTSNSKLAAMKKWLREKYIPYNEDMLKPQLYNLIKANKNMYKKFLIDEILAEHNHAVLRLPLNHPDLNPMEMAWTAIKDYVATKSTKFNVFELTKLVNEKILTMGVNEWVVFCQKIKEIETDYLKSDSIIDSITEQYAICANDDSTDSDDETESENDIEDDIDAKGIDIDDGKIEIKVEPTTSFDYYY